MSNEQSIATPQTLLMGMGNPVLCDDAIGVRMAADIAARLGPQPDLDVFADCSLGGLNLLDVVAGYKRLLIVDSVKTGAAGPGAWYHFTARALRETMNLNNVHDANFATTLELGRRLGIGVPDDDDIHVFAVEIVDNLTFSESMTPLLEEAYPELLAEIETEVRAVLQSGSIDLMPERTAAWT